MLSELSEEYSYPILVRISGNECRKNILLLCSPSCWVCTVYSLFLESSAVQKYFFSQAFRLKSAHKICEVTTKPVRSSFINRPGLIFFFL